MITTFFLEQISSAIQKHSECIEKFDINAWKRDPSTTCLMEKSPFPALDAFVKAIASTGNIPGDAMDKQNSFYSV